MKGLAAALACTLFCNGASVLFAVEIDHLKQTHVLLDFDDAPLREVLEHIARAVPCDVDFDAAIGDDLLALPVTIHLTRPISVKSALNWIVPEVRLDFEFRERRIVVRKEKLKEARSYELTDGSLDLQFQMELMRILDAEDVTCAPNRMCGGCAIVLGDGRVFVVDGTSELLDEVGHLIDEMMRLRPQ